MQNHMDMAASQQEMFRALDALYHQEGTQIKEEASKFLEQWQQQAVAWHISDTVLHDPNSSMEAHYFCAQTLRTKVQRDFEELPANAVDSLRDSLMTLLLRYAKGPPPVRTQLCLALVALTVHVPADRWVPPAGVSVPEPLVGGGAVTWFAVNLQRAPADAALPCLLELLTVLPQEVNSMKYAVRPERRRQHALELRAATGAAINILTGCLSSPAGMGGSSSAQRPAMLEAFGGWLRLSEGAALGPDGSQLASHPLVVACLEGLRSSSDLFHAACDAVCELVWCTVDHATGALDPGMMPLVQALVPAVMALRPRFAVASRRAEEELAEEEGRTVHRTSSIPATDEFDDDEHTAKGMARLFAEVGEAYVHLIATAVQEVQAPVEALLEVAGHPEHTLASMSFNFWHKLARSFTSGWGPKAMAESRNSSGFMDVALEATPEGQAAMVEQARRRAFFRPAFERLVLVVRGKVRYPAKTSSWSKEQFADFRRHRYEIADSLEDCASVLGFTRCLELLIEPLAQLSADQAAGKPFDWRQAEAALFCIRSVGAYALDQGPGQPVQVSQLLAALPTLPRQYPLLMGCSCYTIARYAGWINTSLSAATDAKAGSQALLAALLQLAYACLDIPEASSGACSAILDLCLYCGRHMGPCIPALMQLYQRLQGAGVGTGAAAHLVGAGRGAPAVAEEDVQVVMQAVTVAVCKSVPPEQLSAAATALLQPVLQALQAGAQQLPAVPQQPGPGGTSLHSQHPAICPMVDRLAVLFSYVDNQKVVSEMLVASWGALDMVFSRSQYDRRVMERACRTLRLAIKGAGPEGLPMLPGVLTELASRFRNTRHSAFLYILSELLKIHGQQESCGASLAQALQAMLMDAGSGLNTLDQLQQDPELVDDVYLLAARALSYCPHLLILGGPRPAAGAAVAPSAQAQAQATLTRLLDTALLGVLLQHREACCSVLAFLLRLVLVGREQVPGAVEMLQAVLLPRAPTLTRLLMAGVVGVLQPARLGDVAGVLCALLRAWGQQALSWLGAAMASLPDAVVAPQDKEAFLGAAQVVASKPEGSPQEDRTFEGAVDDLSDVCRRSPRVRVLAQQALLPPELAPAVIIQ